MLDSKRMYSTYFKEYILDDAMLKRLQEELFKILLDIDYVCKKHDIKYMLCGGTLIGAIRHKGFIPWDDDIDLMMIRSEAEKLVVAMREEFPEKYEAILQQQPMRRLGDAEMDIAPVIAFLAGPDSCYYSGQCLLLDGAYSIAP